MLARFTLFSCAAALSVALLPSTAIATHVSCGDVITQDTTLDSDLNDCPGDGLVIGADGVTLDLRGHLLQATDASQGQQGVDNSAGHDDVTVTNGTIREFFDGVFFEGGDDGELSRFEGREGRLRSPPAGVEPEPDTRQLHHRRADPPGRR